MEPPQQINRYLLRISVICPSVNEPKPGRRRRLYVFYTMYVHLFQKSFPNLNIFQLPGPLYFLKALKYFKYKNILNLINLEFWELFFIYYDMTAIS